MKSRIQMKIEHFAEYFHDKMRLCMALSITFPKIKDYIKRDILYKKLAIYLLGRKHTDKYELLPVEWHKGIWTND